MDQSSFRQLLDTGGRGGSTRVTSRGSLLATNPKKPKKGDSAEPAMKPRKVKKADPKYRDRASERRIGEGNDFAEVETLLEEFEKRNAGNEDKSSVDEQRQYLGGDATHTVLVKGLDFALLEQTKAQAEAVNQDEMDDELESAFKEVATSSGSIDAPNKRSRADLLKNLKKGKTVGESTEASAPTSTVSSDLKSSSKFKPIGFKPIGSAQGNPDKPKKKKKKAKDATPDDERKTKRQKLEDGQADRSTPTDLTTASHSLPEMKAPVQPGSALEQDLEPVDPDVDIFVDVGEYEGFDLGDSSDDETGGNASRPAVESTTAPTQLPRGGWFNDNPSPDEPTTESSQPSAGILDLRAKEGTSTSPPQAIRPADDDDDGEDEVVRLQPLTSSAVPSIKDMLAAADAEEKEDKRRARKEKKKRG